MTDLITVTCPTCFEDFGVAAPGPDELPAEIDYDCEVCCRPMVIQFFAEGSEIFGSAHGLGD